MREGAVRRIFDTMVRSSGNDSVSIEVFLADNGHPLFFQALLRFPDRKIEDAVLETFEPDDGKPDRHVLTHLTELEGIPIGPGYIKKVREALRYQEIPDQLLDIIIEAGRMAYQVGLLAPEQIPAEYTRDMRSLRNLDLLYWPDLAEGCLPYTAGAEQLFEELGAQTPARLDVYGPLPGQRVRFRRDKIFECRRTDETNVLHGHLSDDLHELEVAVEFSQGDRSITSLRATPIRLPFRGICNRPFQRVRELEGVPIGADFRERVVRAVGGSEGCVHLADVILDMTRFYDTVCYRMEKRCITRREILS
jgi:hypothetical protein